MVACHPRLLVLSDEIYEQIHYADEPFVSFAAARPDLAERTVIVNESPRPMPCWRIGYAAAPASLARIMGKVQSTSNPCSISQAATVEALTGSQDFVEMARGEFRARRDILIPGLRSMPGIEIIEPDGAFYAYPDLSAFGLSPHLRLSYALSRENIEAAVGRLATALETLS